jgi:hypothetical protein
MFDDALTRNPDADAIDRARALAERLALAGATS